ncbi:MAG: thioredoxin family protein [Saprospiraceae bacterium]|nr:thioredoxin family protein [Saprospiraceae bacterium]
MLKQITALLLLSSILLLLTTACSGDNSTPQPEANATTNQEEQKDQATPDNPPASKIEKETKQGYKVGDVAVDFELKNVDGQNFSIAANLADAKGCVVVFTCNHCPFSVAYEDRLIELDKKYKAQGYPVVAINPNDPEVAPNDSFEKMIERSKEKGFTFPYLFDEGQKVYPQYGAMRTPHCYVLSKEDAGLVVKYIGAIDDNHKEPEKVEKNYLADALDAVIKGEAPSPDYTKAIGCSIKAKKAQ